MVHVAAGCHLQPGFEQQTREVPTHGLYFEPAACPVTPLRVNSNRNSHFRSA
jgi:hypothetical protein